MFWTVTNDGGRPVDLYQVQGMTSALRFDPDRQRETTSANCTLDQLENGTLYSVRVPGQQRQWRDLEQVVHKDNRHPRGRPGA